MSSEKSSQSMFLWCRVLVSKSFCSLVLTCKVCKSESAGSGPWQGGSVAAKRNYSQYSFWDRKRRSCEHLELLRAAPSVCPAITPPVWIRVLLGRVV